MKKLLLLTTILSVTSFSCLAMKDPGAHAEAIFAALQKAIKNKNDSDLENLIQSHKTLITEHHIFWYIDEQDNMLMHQAIYAHNPKAVEFLLKTNHPMLANAEGNTPVMLALRQRSSNSAMSAEIVSLFASDKKTDWDTRYSNAQISALDLLLDNCFELHYHATIQVIDNPNFAHDYKTRRRELPKTLFAPFIDRHLKEHKAAAKTIVAKLLVKNFYTDEPQHNKIIETIFCPAAFQAYTNGNLEALKNIFTQQEADKRAATEQLAEKQKEIIRIEGGIFNACHNACTSKVLETITPLLEKLPKQHRLTYQHPTTGATALHFAAAYDHLPVINLLLAHGADRSIKDAAGDTPCDVAKKMGRKRLYDLLNPTVSLPTLATPLGIGATLTSAQKQGEDPFSDNGTPSSNPGGDASSNQNLGARNVPQPRSLNPNNQDQNVFRPSKPAGQSWITTKKALFGGMALITAALTYYWYHTSSAELTSEELNQQLMTLLTTGNQDDAELAYKLIDNHPTAWNNLADAERVAIQKLLYAYFR